MRAIHYLSSAILGLFIAACAVLQPAPPEVRQALAPSGKLRIGVYVDSPLSMIRDSATGESKGVAFDTGMELAKRLGVAFEVIEYPRVAEVLAALKAGEIDYSITNATAVRAKDVDFTAPLLLLEVGYLVPSGSPISSIAGVDRPGVRIGVTQGSTTQRELPPRLKSATVVPAPSIKAAIEMMSQRQVDAFATKQGESFPDLRSLPGSRVLDANGASSTSRSRFPKAGIKACPGCKNSWPTSSPKGGSRARSKGRDCAAPPRPNPLTGRNPGVSIAGPQDRRRPQ
jgi:polar amino acid transport system substrate-binding protein